MRGQVYVLVNSSFPHLVKIGFSSDPSSRAASLHTTGVPTPFVVAYAVDVIDAPRVERLVHERLRRHRPHGTREFFEVSAKVAIDTLLECSADYQPPPLPETTTNQDRKSLDVGRQNGWQYQNAKKVTELANQIVLMIAAGAALDQSDLEHKIQASTRLFNSTEVRIMVDRLREQHIVQEGDPLVLTKTGQVLARKILGL
jgi:hypothetical protein